MVLPWNGVIRAVAISASKAVAALVETMVHDFLSRLSGNSDAVDRIKDDLNRALRGSVFMGDDLSPNFHPPISGVPVTFEPNGLGEATGRGAEPPA